MTNDNLMISPHHSTRISVISEERNVILKALEDALDRARASKDKVDG